MRTTGAELVQKVSNSRADAIATAVVRNEETSDAAGADLAPTPIFEKDGQFWFWDETSTHALGPYLTRDEAQARLQEYAESLGC